MLTALRLVSLLTVTSGLAHVAPKPQDQFDSIAWAADYASALSEATAQHKPLLVVMVAGPRDGEC